MFNCFLQSRHNEEATDIMHDTSKSGRWVSFCISSTSDYVVAEADKKLGDHIKSLSVFNKAIMCLISPILDKQMLTILTVLLFNFNGVWFIYYYLEHYHHTTSKHHEHHVN